jgi:hypothetical protein
MKPDMSAGSLTKVCMLKTSSPAQPSPAWGMIGLFEISEPSVKDLQLPILCPSLMLVVDYQLRQREMSFQDPDRARPLNNIGPKKCQSGVLY